MNHSGKVAMAVVVACLLTLSAPEGAFANGGGSVTVEVGHSYTQSFGKTPFESKPTITVDKPGIASVKWKGEESGSLIITGEAEGDAVVTVKGKIRVANFGGGPALTVKEVTGKIYVKVTADGEYARVVVLFVDQKMSVKFPDGLTLGAHAPKNSNPPVVFVRRNSGRQLTLTGKKVGESMLRFKLLVEQKKGKDKEVPGSIWVIVKKGKAPKKKKYIKIGWEDLPTGIITIDGKVMVWVPDGGNYGKIGDACFANVSDQDQTCGVEDGSWVECNDGQYQDFVVTEVPTYGEDPPSGCTSLDETFPLPTETTVVLKDMPGVCATFELPPPPAGQADSFALTPPNEQSKELVDVVDTVSQIDFTQKPLAAMTPDQAKATACQAAVWQAGSYIDGVEGNEVTDEQLEERFFDTYLAAAATAREEMTPEDRDEMDQTVRDDLATVVGSIDFAAKTRTQ